MTGQRPEQTIVTSSVAAGRKETRGRKAKQEWTRRGLSPSLRSPLCLFVGLVCQLSAHQVLDQGFPSRVASERKLGRKGHSLYPPFPRPAIFGATSRYLGRPMQ